MAVIADFEHYPDWVDSMKSAEVLSFGGGKAKTGRMVLDHTVVKDDYLLAYEWKPQVVSWIGFKRRAEKTIIDGAVKGLKKRVEG